MKLLIETALYHAYFNHKVSKIAAIEHRERSKSFVEALASGFRNHYKSNDSVYVFSKHFYDNRKKFGLNELLFDILVCNGDTRKSVTGKRMLTHITSSIWQVESEFAKDSRQALYDFNKLVLGASENKLFIGSQISHEKEFLDALALPAKHCHATTYLALMPHPKDWKDNMGVSCWRFDIIWNRI